MPAKSPSLRSNIELALPAVMVVGLPLLLSAALPAAPSGSLSTGQIFQGFDGQSGEDLTAFRRDDRALWGRDSALSATSHFPGDGGPGGDFDWTIRGNETFVLDTTLATITNADQTATQQVVNGVVNVRNLTVEGTGVLRITGPNACRIAATGTVRVDGRIDARGENNRGVVTFNIGEPCIGSPGGPGGGRGGSSSLLVTQSTPQGEAGYGAFGSALPGGGGGETGFHPQTDVNNRRGSGGGGGRFAANTLLPSGCPDQTRIGLDVEQGGPGAPLANSAIGGVGVRPAPGVPGGSPFTDGDSTNNFWGRMITTAGATIVGELPRPWAGAGGGAGGDAYRGSVFPNPNFSPPSDEVGGGGGGGGGSLAIYALRDIVLGSTARIDVSGGTGGGGENSNGIDRIGAAGGGGSGGHLVLQAGRTVDLRACTITPQGNNGFLALGGQGGEGRDGDGGSNTNGVQTTPALDSINLVAPFDASCLVPAPTFVNWVGSGGDGGPGLVQIHVDDLGAILLPTNPNVTLDDVLKPAPVGAVVVDDPTTWNRLVPSFGPKSSARSQWIAIGTGGLIAATFGATDATGRVQTTGNHPNARVAQAYSIVEDLLNSSPNAPIVDVDGRSLLIDQAAFLQDVWWTHPDTLVDASLQMGPDGSSQRFDIESASITGGIVRVTVAGAGTPLAGFTTGTPVTLRPRFFRVATDGVRDLLPGSASIRITFQGAPADFLGNPNTALAGPWTPNAGALSNVPGIAFVRYQVDFDLTADGSELTNDSPRPALEYIRIPYLP